MKKNITAICTWPAEDVCIVVKNHFFMLFEDPKQNQPPKVQLKHGFVTCGHLPLTSKEAKQLGYDLINAANTADGIEREYKEYCEAQCSKSNTDQKD